MKPAAEPASPATNSPPGQPQAAPVPLDHTCTRCGYPSGRSGSRICPECGWVATQADLELVVRRAEALAAWREQGRQRAKLRWVIVVGVYAAGAGVVGGMAAAFLYALVALPIAVALSWWMGDWCVFRSRPERRAYLNMVWRRTLWILHAPWLVAPLFVVVALIAGLVDVWAGRAAGDAYPIVVWGGFFLWLIGCLASFCVWWGTRLKTVNRGGYRAGRADAFAFFAGLVVTTGACWLGLCAGLVTAFGIAQWLHLGLFLD